MRATNAAGLLLGVVGLVMTYEMRHEIGFGAQRAGTPPSGMTQPNSSSSSSSSPSEVDHHHPSATSPSQQSHQSPSLPAHYSQYRLHRRFPHPDAPCDDAAKYSLIPALACNDKAFSLFLLGDDLPAVEARCSAEFDQARRRAMCPPTLRAKAYNKGRGGSLWKAEWKRRHAALRSEAAQSNPRIVFIGDSLTSAVRKGEPFPELHQHFKDVFDVGDNAPLALGIPGDETQALLFRMLNGELADTKPDVVVLLVGTNNLNWGKGDARDVTLVSQGIIAIAQLLRLLKPHSKLLLLGVLPRGGKCAVRKGRRFARCKQPFDVTIAGINAELRAWAEGLPGVTFADCGAWLSLEEGSGHYMFDFTHFLPAGYASMWRGCVVPTLKSIVPLPFRNATLPERKDLPNSTADDS